MRNSLQLIINGQQHVIDGESVFQTLSTYLRDSLGLIGTKIVCSEGDCGICSVLVGRLNADGRTLHYEAIDSCIVFLYQLDQTHIVTIEDSVTKGIVAGPGCNGPVSRQPMWLLHTRLCHDDAWDVRRRPYVERPEWTRLRLDEQTLRIGLSGNLCRCTGYVQIIECGTIDIHQRCCSAEHNVSS